MLLLAFAYGLSLMLYGMMNYTLSIWMAGFYVVATFVVERIVFKSKKIFVFILILTLASLAFAAYLMHRQEALVPQLIKIGLFLDVYVQSILLNNVAIEGAHEVLASFLIAFGIHALLHGLFEVKKLHFRYLLMGTTLFTALSLLGYGLENILSHIGFYIVSLSMVVYFFFHYYKTHISIKKKFSPFIGTILLVALLVVQLAHVGYLIYPDPFRPEPGKSGAAESENGQKSYGDREAYELYQQSFTAISEQFAFEHIPIMAAKTEFTRYLKGDVFENYTAGGWLKSPDVQAILLPTLLDSLQIDEADIDQYYVTEPIEIQLIDVTTDVLFTSAYDVNTIRIPSETPYFFDPNRGTFSTYDKLTEGFAYGFESVTPRYGYETLKKLINDNADQALPESLAPETLLVPDGFDRVRTLTLEITQDLEAPYDKALAIEAYLKENYTYTEEPLPVPEAGDPVEHFLFTSLEGFCQQFSSSMIIMLRSIGIPARYVTGYYVEPLNMKDFDMPESLKDEFLVDGYQTVYDDNYHAWVEAYFPEVGWIIMDPTPGRSYTFTESGELTPSTPLPPKEEVTETNKDEPSVSRWPSPLTVLSIMVFMVVAYALYWLMQHKKHLGQLEKEDRILRTHHVILKYYAQLGFKKSPTETPREYANRIDLGLMPIYVFNMNKLMDAYEAIVYGEIPATDDQLKHYDGYLKAARYFMKFKLSKTKYYMLRTYDFFTL